MKRALNLKVAVTLSLLAFVVPISANAVDPTPAPSTTTPISSLVPNYRDQEIPQIQSLATSSSKVGDQFTLSAEIAVKIRSNALNSIEINFLPKSTPLTDNPKLMPPCVKLGSLKSAPVRVGIEMPTLQSRVASNGSYIEKHIVSFVAKLPLVQYATEVPTYQDICDGQYVISTIILKDAAAHVLTITANASSVASSSTTSSTTNKTSTTSTKGKFTDASIMQADFWTDTLPMPCSPSNNLAPTQISSVVGGKTVQSMGIPATSPTIRTTCNQILDFSKIYLNVNGTTSNQTTAVGSTTLPIVDYVSQTKTALSENARMKNQMEILNRQIDSLKNTVSILRGGGKLPADTPYIGTTSETSSAGTATDYKALAASLQLQVDKLKKQIAAATPKKTAAPKTTAKPKVTAKPQASPSRTSWRPQNR